MQEKTHYCNNCKEIHLLSEYITDSLGRKYCSRVIEFRKANVQKAQRVSIEKRRHKKLARPVAIERWCKQCSAYHLLSELNVTKNGKRYCKVARSGIGRKSGLKTQQLYRTDAVAKARSQTAIEKGRNKWIAKIADDPVLQARYKELGRTNLTNFHAKRRNDPILDSQWRENFSRIGKALSERRKADPELDTYLREVSVRAGKKGGKKGGLLRGAQLRAEAEERYLTNPDNMPTRTYAKVMLGKYLTKNDWSVREYVQKIEEQSGDACYLCGEALTGSLSIDHIYPITHFAGASERLMEFAVSLDNVFMVHSSCNSKKQSKLPQNIAILGS